MVRCLWELYRRTCCTPPCVATITWPGCSRYFVDPGLLRSLNFTGGITLKRIGPRRDLAQGRRYPGGLRQKVRQLTLEVWPSACRKGMFLLGACAMSAPKTAKLYGAVDAPGLAGKPLWINGSVRPDAHREGQREAVPQPERHEEWSY